MPEILHEPETAIDVRGNLEGVKDRLNAAALEAGRAKGCAKVVAVSKKHGPERILPALEAGHRTYGENRVQEAKAKWPALKECFPGVELHLVGPLQSNKAGEAVELFDVIETVDREKIARVLGEEIRRQGRDPVLFVQINTGDEPQKAGVSPQSADDFIRKSRDEFGLAIAGVMCIPPVDEPPAPHFALLAKIAERNGLSFVSMGMSADFEVAVQLGATHVRVGSQIFGDRPE